MSDHKLTKKESVEKAIQFGNSWRLDSCKTSNKSEIDKFVEYIFTEMKRSENITIPFQGIYLQNLINHIKVILCNLMYAYLSDKERYISYARDGYKEVRKYKGFQFSRLNVKKVTNFLINNGYVENQKGYPESEYSEKAHLSKMRSTQKLGSLMDKFELTPTMIKRDISNQETIIMKDFKPEPQFRKKKQADGTYKTIMVKIVKQADGSYKTKEIKNREKRKVIKTPDNRIVRGVRNNLEIINPVLANANITLDLTQEELRVLNAKLNSDRNRYKQAIDFTRKTLHRVFLDRSIKRGGRFYGGWWQNIPKWARKRIQINGEDVDEPDFSAYHPRILYARKGLAPPNSDPYTLPGYKDAGTRTFLKRALLIVLNTSAKTIDKARKIAIKRIEYDVSIEDIIKPDEITNISEIIDKFAVKHQPISEYFFTGYGITLMNIDSKVAEAILLHFAKQGVPVLPVHDSFIIDYRLSEEMRGVMVDAALKEIKQLIPTDSNMEELKEFLENRIKDDILEKAELGRVSGRKASERLKGFVDSEIERKMQRVYGDDEIPDDVDLRVFPEDVEDHWDEEPED